MKKLIVLFYSLVIAVNSFAYDSVEIDKRVMQSFDSSFPEAIGVRWHELEKSYVVHFVEKNIRYNIEYAKDQSSVNVTRYYKEKDLPFYVRYLMKKAYPRNNIFGVTEISSVSTGAAVNIDYYITMEDGKKWITVKLDNAGNRTIVERLNKA
jgi:hypothetical protein